MLFFWRALALLVLKLWWLDPKLIELEMEMRFWAHRSQSAMVETFCLISGFKTCFCILLKIAGQHWVDWRGQRAKLLEAALNV